jgi:hypothetical protein
MQDKLFRYIPTAALLHVNQARAIDGPLAHYVLTDFPHELEACAAHPTLLADMAVRQQRILEHERRRIECAQDRRAAHEAQLDMVMLLGGYLLDKEKALQLAPPLLLELLAHNGQRHGFAQRMTYELIVDVNTEAFVRSGGHVRIFSSGNGGLIERDFYIGHHFAEKHIRSAFEILRAILEAPQQAQKTERLAIALEGLKQFTEYMSAFGRLPHGEYAYFRRFLSAYPDKVKNASGAFMPTPQLFEMLLHEPAYAQRTFLADNAPYFSGAANELFRVLQEQAGSGRTVEVMIGRLGLTAQEAALMRAIVEQFIQFKLIHIRVASSKIPEAFPKPPILERDALHAFRPLRDSNRSGSGVQQGTGGFVPQDFLGDGVRRLLELQQRLFAIG